MLIESSKKSDNLIYVSNPNIHNIEVFYSIKNYDYSDNYILKLYSKYVPIMNTDKTLTEILKEIEKCNSDDQIKLEELMEKCRSYASLHNIDIDNQKEMELVNFGDYGSKPPNIDYKKIPYVHRPLSSIFLSLSNYTGDENKEIKSDIAKQFRKIDNTLVISINTYTVYI